MSSTHDNDNGGSSDSNDDTNRERGDVLSDAHNYILEDFDESYNTRTRSFMVTQSLKEFNDAVDDSSVLSIMGRRSGTERMSAVNEVPYFNIRMNREVDSRLNWDVRTRDTSLDMQRIIDISDSYDFHDVCVSNVVVQFWDDELYDSLQSMLLSIGGHSVDLDSFEQPFVMELSSTPVNENEAPELYQVIHDRHPSKYWSPTGLNWDVRSMDVEGLWTRASYEDPTVSAGLYNGMPITLRQLEDYAFNQTSDDAPQYGVIDTKLFSHCVEDFFGPENVAIRRWDWVSSGGWEPA